jgi:signal recognition particle subunit SRP19
LSIIVWSVYINALKTKKEGRKIAKEHCIKNPELNEIARASSKLNFNSRIENNKSYPSSWWEKSGRVIIETNMKKNDALKKISSLIKEFRVSHRQ